MAKQVAKLMQVIGEESNMNYGCDESGTDIVNGKNWLINHGYTGGNETGYNFSTAISSLKNGSPILMGGFDTKHSSIFSTSYSGGHAWVVDGYADAVDHRLSLFIKLIALFPPVLGRFVVAVADQLICPFGNKVSVQLFLHRVRLSCLLAVIALHGALD